MKVKFYWLGFLILMWGCQSVPVQSDYVVIAGKGVEGDTAWYPVVKTLADKHRAKVLAYRESPGELLEQ